MEFEDVYNNERVTRKFTSKRVGERLLAEIVKEAQYSPSLLNSQPWLTYAIMGKPLTKLKRAYREKVDADVKPHEDFAALLSLDWDTYPSENLATMGASQTYFFQNKLDLFTQANYTMFNAPAILFLTLPKKSPIWSIFDLGIFAQTIMLTAIDKGLDVMPAHSMVAYPELVHKYASIPEDKLVGMAIGLGYKDKNAEVNDPKFYPDRASFRKMYKLTK